MQQHPGISRRIFLHRLALLAGLATVYPATALAERRADTAGPEGEAWLDRDPWKTLAAVQEHLLPATDAVPGAGDIGAAAYLRRAIENPDADAEDKTFLMQGVGWLNELTRERHGRPFAALPEETREAALRDIEKSRAGRNWLSLLLTYLLEALLADPVYGGNPNGIGWQWLEHQPGFPTPPLDKTWHRLASRRQVAPKGK
ncbi:MAG: gluconate 2-dehydrogenase subunit 3 family protein [Gammaproteobacteria bacterium]|jgi:gluconate 2-dehydrogenase gamma chain